MCHLTVLNSARVGSAGSPLYNSPLSNGESGKSVGKLLSVRRRISADTGGTGGIGGGMIDLDQHRDRTQVAVRLNYSNLIDISIVAELGLVLSEEISCCSDIWRSWTGLASVFIMAIERVEKSRVPRIPKRATKSSVPALNVYPGAGEISVSPALIIALSIVWRVSMLLMATENK